MPNPPELATSLEATPAERLLQAEGLVRDYCGWHIAPERTVVKAVAGSGARELMLPSLHIVAVAEVIEDGNLVDASSYVVHEEGFLTRSAAWETWGTGVITVTFDHGFGPTQVPPAVIGVVMAVAQRGVDNPGSLVRVQRGPFSDTYSQSGFNQALPLSLLEAERDALAPYRIVAVR